MTPSVYDDDSMEASFVTLFNSIAGTDHTSADEVFRHRKKRDVAAVNVAFNALAVMQGLRDVTFVGGLPHDWRPPSWAKLRYRRFSGRNTVFLGNSDRVTERDFRELCTHYDGNDPKWNVELGRRLGYMQPSSTKKEDDDYAILSMLLSLPGGREIVSEYGPQTLVLNRSRRSDLLRDLRVMREKWARFAKAIHPEFKVYVQMTLIGCS